VSLGGAPDFDAHPTFWDQLSHKDRYGLEVWRQGACRRDGRVGRDGRMTARPDRHRAAPRAGRERPAERDWNLPFSHFGLL